MFSQTLWLGFWFWFRTREVERGMRVGLTCTSHPPRPTVLATRPPRPRPATICPVAPLMALHTRICAALSYLRPQPSLHCRLACRRRCPAYREEHPREFTGLPVANGVAWRLIVYTRCPVDWLSRLACLVAPCRRTREGAKPGCPGRLV